MQTRDEALAEFIAELRAYANRSTPGDIVMEQGRQDACQAHAIRLERIAGLPVLPPTEQSAVFGPGDAAVVVSVPSGAAPTLMCFGRTGGPDASVANVQDLMITCTLLEHALNRARSAYWQAKSSETSATPQRPIPVPPPYPGF
jgi:hypothetical protein